MYRPGNLAPLETVALAAVTVVQGRRPRTLAEFLGGRPDRLSEHPWYDRLRLPLPVATTAAGIDDASDLLHQRAKRHGVVLAAAEARPVLEGALNSRLEATGNKARVELEVIERLLEDHLPADRSGKVLCDRLGGRKRYSDWLAGQFPFWRCETEEEARLRSAYTLRRDDVTHRFRFLVRGEEAAVEIALASCLAKYVRETLMLSFNRFWARHREHVAPTAGYWQDAGRWLEAMAGEEVFEAHKARLVRRR